MTNAADAREQSGYSLQNAAARLRVGEAYLRQCERNGFPFALAVRATRLYGRLDDFLPRKQRERRTETAQSIVGGETSVSQRPDQSRLTPGGR